MAGDILSSTGEPTDFDPEILLPLMAAWAVNYNNPSPETLNYAQDVETFLALAYEIPDDQLLGYSSEALTTIIKWRLAQAREGAIE